METILALLQFVLVYVFVLRFLLSLTVIFKTNPISRFFDKITKNVIVFFKMLTPDITKYELSSVSAAIVLHLLVSIIVAAIFLPSMLTYSQFWQTSIILAIYTTIKAFVKLFYFTIIINAICSWFGYPRNAVLDICYVISDLCLRPLRSIIPPVGMLDLSALAALIILQILDGLF